MPFYTYQCETCGHKRNDMRLLQERNDGPTCDTKAHGQMKLIIDAPPMGIVRNPAVPSGRKRNI